MKSGVSQEKAGDKDSFDGKQSKQQGREASKEPPNQSKAIITSNVKPLGLPPPLTLGQMAFRPRRPRADSDVAGGSVRASREQMGKSTNFFPLSAEQMNSAVKILHPVPARWPQARWDTTRLENHWKGKKRGKGKATAHHTEFEILGIPKIKSAAEFSRFFQAFMSPHQPKREHIIERMSQDNNHILRYDYKLNLYGIVDKNTGMIGTFFRPGYKVGIGPFPPRLEPSIVGFSYFKRYVETGVGSPNR